MGRSRGTLPIQLAGNIKRGGLVERAFGVSLRELLYDYGGGSATRHGRSARCRSAARSAPTCRPSQFDTAARLRGAGRRSARCSGHGGIVVFDDTVDMARMARYAMEFCAIESCGKCTPCRIGSTRGVEVIDRILAGVETASATCGCSRSCATPWCRGRCAAWAAWRRFRCRAPSSISGRTFARDRRQ